MQKYLSISKKQPAFPDYLDFQALRQIGIDFVQKLSNKLWTDYNLHDPGVTILEELCYAITDLGYRNNLDIEDLLALNLKDADGKENNFFTPDALLTCNPVTELDLRKRLIDIPGVRNAWLERLGVVNSPSIQPQKVENYEPEIYVDPVNGHLQYQIPDGKTQQTAIRLNPKGLYRVYLDLELNIIKEDAREQIVEQVKQVLCSYRNLCEDFEKVEIWGEEEIGLCAAIELEANGDPEDVLVEIYVRVQAFLSPRLRFYTLSELLNRGKSPAEIFAGRPSAIYDATTVYQSNGFIDLAELAALTPPQVIHTSDLYQIIMAVPGVAAIKKLSIVNYINGLAQAAEEPWCLKLTDKHRPVLGITRSQVTFSKGNLPFKAVTDEVERRYYQQQATGIKSPLDQHELDLAIPQGTYYDLADYYSIHHDFPVTYGIGEEGLPGTASALRQGQANQLKGYLIFFDQVLANYLAQLAHVRDLFSWESEKERQKPIDDIWQQNRQHTYFTQALTNLPGVEELVRDYLHSRDRNSSGETPTDYIAVLDSISEDRITYFDRRNRFLDHLLARFAESFSDYVQLNYQLDGGRRQDNDIIEDKARFLREYPEFSRDRFRAFNYGKPTQIWNTDNVSGFQKRVSRFLGTDLDTIRNQDKLWRRSLNHYQIIDDTGGFGFSLNRGELSLLSKRTYSTPEEAQAALAEFLVLAQNPAHYRRLTYRGMRSERRAGSSEFTSYGYGVMDAQGNLWAESAERFATIEQRNQNLQRWVQSNQTDWTTDTPQQQPAYIGRVDDAAGNILLQEIQRHAYGTEGRENARRAACQSGNTLVELAQIQENFCLIDDEDGGGIYSWELTNHSKDRILAVPPHPFSSSAERDQSIAAIQARIDDEGFHVVEHILLRPKHPPSDLQMGDNFLPIAKYSPTPNTPSCTAAYDPYSFWISVILPYWPARFRNMNFRQLVERTLRLEAPAHVGLKICWVDVCQMQEFETAYHDWLEHLACNTCQDATHELTSSLNRLIDILSHLKNVYPKGTLNPRNQSDPNDNPIVLNQTALGTANSQE